MMKKTYIFAGMILALIPVASVEAQQYYSYPAQGSVSRYFNERNPYQNAQPVYGSRPVRYNSAQPVYQVENYAGGRYQNNLRSLPVLKQYISLRGSYSQMSNDIDYRYSYQNYSESETLDIDDDVFGISAAYGLKYGFARAEIEGIWYGESEDDLYGEGYPEDKVKLSQYAFMFNVYADFDNKTNITPYIGGGIGYAHMKAEYYGGDKKKGNFAWQLGGGINIAASDNLSFDIGYRYMNSGDMSVQEEYAGNVEKYELESTSHNVYAGIRYVF